MSESVFFVKGRNKGNERKVLLHSATLLVGKAPTKTKRIKMRVSIPLGSKPVGTPEWVMHAYEYVSQNHDEVVPDGLSFSGFNIHFDDEQLFDKKGARAEKCQMRSFSIHEAGEAENPDVVMTFLVYAPFTRRLWNYCGEMGGEEFWARFDQIEIEESNELELTGDEVEEESEEVEAAE